MKRLIVALCTLLVGIIALLGEPERLNAASPPPPCPNGDTFIFCLNQCPTGSLEEKCLNMIDWPPNCRVEQPFCYDISPPYWCEPSKFAQLWCPYKSTY